MVMISLAVMALHAYAQTDDFNYIKRDTREASRLM